MLERHIDVLTADGAMNSFVTQPEQVAQFPLVILLMDAPGMREELFDMARRLGQQGYCVAVPNLYYRRTRLGSFGADREAMYGHMLSLTAPAVCADLEALAVELAASPGVAGGPLGCVGYCMSGPFALAAAAHFGARCGAAASFHGVRLCHQGQDSAHRQLARITAPLYIGCAAADAWAPPRLIELLERQMQRAGLVHQVEWYPNTRHGFVFPQRKTVYHHQAAERHWQRLTELFRANLPKPTELA